MAEECDKVFAVALACIGGQLAAHATEDASRRGAFCLALAKVSRDPSKGL
jgi:hypothetical protein